jgi:hypothetical protein
VYVQRACSSIAAVVLVFPVEPNGMVACERRGGSVVEPLATFATRQDGPIYKGACIECTALDTINEARVVRAARIAP